MTIEDDTEWLRARLTDEGFHRDYSEKWIAVRDGKVAHNTSDRQALQTWLEKEDTEGRCVLAFGDPRVFV
jgi:hypothetical protein